MTVRNVLVDASVVANLPVISLPTKVTSSIWPLFMRSTKSEKVMSLLPVLRLAENCQMSARMTTRTIQNSRLFNVEFTGSPSSIPRLPRLPQAS